MQSGARLIILVNADVAVRPQAPAVHDCRDQRPVVVVYVFSLADTFDRNSIPPPPPPPTRVRTPPAVVVVYSSSEYGDLDSLWSCES